MNSTELQIKLRTSKRAGREKTKREKILMPVRWLFVVLAAFREMAGVRRDYFILGGRNSGLRNFINDSNPKLNFTIKFHEISFTLGNFQCYIQRLMKQQ